MFNTESIFFVAPDTKIFSDEKALLQVCLKNTIFHVGGSSRKVTQSRDLYKSRTFM